MRGPPREMVLIAMRRSASTSNARCFSALLCMVTRYACAPPAAERGVAVHGERVGRRAPHRRVRIARNKQPLPGGFDRQLKAPTWA